MYHATNEWSADLAAWYNSIGSHSGVYMVCMYACACMSVCVLWLYIRAHTYQHVLYTFVVLGIVYRLYLCYAQYAANCHSRTPHTYIVYIDGPEWKPLQTKVYLFTFRLSRYFSIQFVMCRALHTHAHTLNHKSNTCHCCGIHHHTKFNSIHRLAAIVLVVQHTGKICSVKTQLLYNSYMWLDMSKVNSICRSRFLRSEKKNKQMVQSCPRRSIQ